MVANRIVLKAGLRNALRLSVVSPLILTFSPLRGEGTACGQALIFENLANGIEAIMLFREKTGLRNALSRVVFSPLILNPSP
jgi:hypothetical protein